MILYNCRLRFMRHLAVLAMLLLICMVLSACREEQEKIYRMGILSEVEAFTVISDGFKVKMAELGYMYGENISYDTQIASVDPEQEKQAARKFVQKKVDLIFAFPTEARQLATPESHLIINYKVMKELGLPVSDGLLSRATSIIR